MCLAVPQIRLLTLTSRKNTIEKNLSVEAMHKMQMAREMTQLSRDYQSKLNQKTAVYYDNGKWEQVNYGYFMGYYDKHAGIMGNGDRPVKSNMATILTDYRGQVVLSDDYARAILNVCGSAVSYSQNQGGTFDKNKIPEILFEMFPRGGDPNLYAEGIQNYTYSVNWENALDGTGQGTGVVDGSAGYNEYIDRIVSFYYPILLAAATNGWTTEYNNEIGSNSDYVQDALTSGIFCLATVGEYGYYEPNTSLTYYATSGEIELRSDSEKRETVTAWYDAEKERISYEETVIDLEIEQLSTELEAIKTEIDSVNNLIKDAMESFNWCS